jgi:hypothetical protein
LSRAEILQEYDKIFNSFMIIKPVKSGHDIKKLIQVTSFLHRHQCMSLGVILRGSIDKSENGKYEMIKFVSELTFRITLFSQFMQCFKPFFLCSRHEVAYKLQLMKCKFVRESGKA